MSSQATNSGGIGLFGAIFLVFLVLKLTGYIAWSWWWVTAPLWGAFLFFFVIFTLLAAIQVWAEDKADEARRRR